MNLQTLAKEIIEADNLIELLYAVSEAAKSKAKALEPDFSKIQHGPAAERKNSTWGYFHSLALTLSRGSTTGTVSYLQYLRSQKGLTRKEEEEQRQKERIQKAKNDMESAKRNFERLAK